MYLNVTVLYSEKCKRFKICCILMVATRGAIADYCIISLLVWSRTCRSLFHGIVSIGTINNEMSTKKTAFSQLCNFVEYVLSKLCTVRLILYVIAV